MRRIMDVPVFVAPKNTHGTLQDWEQGRHKPSGAAKTLLFIAARTSDAVRAVA